MEKALLGAFAILCAFASKNRSEQAPVADAVHSDPTQTSNVVPGGEASARCTSSRFSGDAKVSMKS